VVSTNVHVQCLLFGIDIFAVRAFLFGAFMYLLDVADQVELVGEGVGADLTLMRFDPKVERYLQVKTFTSLNIYKLRHLQA
jgi:hypothetical protein